AAKGSRRRALTTEGSKFRSSRSSAAALTLALRDGLVRNGVVRNGVVRVRLEVTVDVTEGVLMVRVDISEGVLMTRVDITEGVVTTRVDITEERPWPWAAGAANARRIGPARASRPRAVNPKVRRGIGNLLGDERTD